MTAEVKHAALHLSAVVSAIVHTATLPRSQAPASDLSSFLTMSLKIDRFMGENISRQQELNKR